ncbi:MAG: ABC transporter substrate-binding protein [Elusimicrobiales bacterium]|nr:ABC transporter substrate-binding protein [Elusimicrobiales bacterium]
MNRYFIILSFFMILFVGCSKVNRNKLLYFAHTGEITSLDPSYSYDAITHGTLINIYETLIGFDGNKLDSFIPLISMEVPSKDNGLISKDGSIYVFPIRRGIKFHNGDELIPEDVKYSLLRFMITDMPGGPSSLLLEPIFGVSSIKDGQGNLKITKEQFERAIKIDGDNVVIKLEKPFAPFLSIIARWSYVINSRFAIKLGEWDGKYETIRNYLNRSKDKSVLINKECGTGPFFVSNWDQAKKQIILKSFDSYWRGKSKIDLVIQKTVNEFSTRKLMIENGDADIIEVPRIYESQLEGIENIKVYSELKRLSTDPVFFFTFDINTTANPDIGSGKLDGKGIPPDFFKDKDVRKAFAYSFNYDLFLKETLRNKGDRAYSPVPKSVALFDMIKVYDYNLKKAEYHFKKAFGGKLWEKGFKFTLTYNTGSDIRQIACEILKKEIESINSKFKIDIRGIDWALYLEKAQNRKMPLFTRGWVGDYADPHNFIFAFYHSEGRYPKSQGFVNKELDRLIELAVKENNWKNRKKIYEKIINIANEEVYQIYTVHPYGLIAVRKEISGFVDNPVYMGIYYYTISKGNQ